MSTWQYAPLLQLEVRHSYYDGGGCSDWEWEASPATLDLLARHHILVRIRGGQMLLVAERVGGDWRFPLAPEVQLVFHLRLGHHGFPAITDPSMCPGQDILLMGNALNGNADNLVQGLQRVYAKPTAFDWRLPEGMPEGTAADLENAAGEVVAVAQSEGGVMRVVAPQGSLGYHRLVFRSQPQASPVGFYLGGRDIQGVGGIVQLDNGVGAGLAGRSFVLPFAARTSPWTYMALVWPSSSAVDCVMRHREGLVDFDDISTLIEEGSRESYLRAQLLAQHPDGRVWAWRSRQALPLREGPVPDIQLVRRDQPEESVLIGHCPAPTAEGPVVLRHRLRGIGTV